MKVKLKLNILSVKNYSKTKKGIVSDANMLSLIQAKRENQEKLFSVNVRGDLFNIKTIRKNPVANSIKETIIQIMENKIEPNSFYWRNQGGIMFAKSITDIGDGYYEVEMTEEYHGIGNGQQTISLSDYFSNKYEIHKDIEMPMRILIGFSEKECREMCKTNNTSNKITTKDVISNDWSTIAKEWQELNGTNLIYKRDGQKIKTTEKDIILFETNYYNMVSSYHTQKPWIAGNAITSVFGPSDTNATKMNECNEVINLFNEWFENNEDWKEYYPILKPTVSEGYVKNFMLALYVRFDSPRDVNQFLTETLQVLKYYIDTNYGNDIPKKFFTTQAEYNGVKTVMSQLRKRKLELV